MKVPVPQEQQQPFTGVDDCFNYSGDKICMNIDLLEDDVSSVLQRFYSEKGC